MLRHVRAQEITYHVGVELLQDVLDIDADAPALGELLPLEVEELVGRHIVGQIQPAIAHEHRRPDDCVEGDVVLPDEIVRLDVGVLPELPPIIGLADDIGILLGGGQVSDDRLEPDIDHLVVHPGYRYGHAPGHVPCDGPVLQPGLQPVLREQLDVRSPVVLVLDPAYQRLLERGEPEEVVVRLPELRRRPADRAAGVAQLACLVGGAAFLALVTPCSVVTAFLAAPFDVPVGEELGALRAIVLQRAVPIQVAVLHQLVEEIVDHFEVVLGGGLGEQREIDAQVLDGLLVHTVVPFRHLLGSGLLLLGADRDGRSMHVRSGHHEHLVTFERMIFREHVRRQEGTCHMSEMKRAVGVGPSNADQYFCHIIEIQNTITRI